MSASAPPRSARWPVLGWLDRWLYRRPFEGQSGLRYLRNARPAFESFDDRVLDLIAEPLGRATCMLELGAGGGAFACAAAARFPRLRVLAVEPSDVLARRARAAAAARPSIRVLRARAEALPLRTASVEVAACISSLRHFSDRERSLLELRRVLVPGGTLVIAELDPQAPARRIAHHAEGLRGRALGLAFGALVVRTAPPAHQVVALAERAGFSLRRRVDDPLQPLYVLELTR